MTIQSLEDWTAFLKNAVITASISSVVFLVLAVALDAGAGLTGHWIRIGAVTVSIIAGYAASRGLNGELPDVRSVGMVAVLSVLAVIFLQTPLIRLTPAGFSVVSELLPVFVMAAAVDVVSVLASTLLEKED